MQYLRTIRGVICALHRIPEPENRSVCIARAAFTRSLISADDSGFSEEHDHGKAENERRRNDRQHGDHLEKAA